MKEWRDKPDEQGDRLIRIETTTIGVLVAFVILAVIYLALRRGAAA